jgi:ferric-dicitrate binding protein FerR (iron transport regulator)
MAKGLWRQRVAPCGVAGAAVSQGRTASLIGESRLELASLDLAQDALDRVMLLDAGQAHVEALKLDAQPAVVDAQAVEDRGIEVVDVHRVRNDVVAKIVSP